MTLVWLGVDILVAFGNSVAILILFFCVLFGFNGIYLGLCGLCYCVAC